MGLRAMLGHRVAPADHGTRLAICAVEATFLVVAGGRGQHGGSQPHLPWNKATVRQPLHQSRGIVDRGQVAFSGLLMPRKEERSGSGPASAVTPTEPVGQRLSLTRHCGSSPFRSPMNPLSQGSQAVRYATKWLQIGARQPYILAGQERAVQVRRCPPACWRSGCSKMARAVVEKGRPTGHICGTHHVVSEESRWRP